jgi:para-aminobenzoate synthetase component 1
MCQIEMEHVSVCFEFVYERSILGQAISSGDMVVQDDDLLGHPAEFLEFVACRGDVDEADERVLTFAQADAIFVPARDEMSGIAPGAPYGPDSPESIRAARMVETDFLQHFNTLRCHDPTMVRPGLAGFAGGERIIVAGAVGDAVAHELFASVLDSCRTGAHGVASAPSGDPMFQSCLRIALAALDRPAKPVEWLRIVEELHTEPGFWWLDSALTDARLGRYSFAGADPYLVLRANGTAIEVDVRRQVRLVRRGLERGVHRLEGDPIEFARSLLPRTDSLVYSSRTTTQLGQSPASQWHEASGLTAGLALPFLGGAVGYFGYELASTLESGLSFENVDDLGLPDLSLAFVDQVLAFDHESERLWIVGLGFDEGEPAEAFDARESSVVRSREVVDALSIRLESVLSEAPDSTSHCPSRFSAGADRNAGSDARFAFSSTVDASGYAKAVDTLLEEIAAGNVYQANYSQRLTTEAKIDPWQIYQALRIHNPAPFGGYLSLSDAAILSSSPERFLRLDGARRVESRPIKGTRPRGKDEAEDLRLSAELTGSPKDRAENLMIVDLVRNDLGRVCAPHSIAVPELMKIEAYAKVFQMVSTVTGRLETDRDAFDLLRATFPPGSMTGAPKLAAIALLEKLEQVKRGVYAGALGYLDLRGGLDLSVVIRTIVWKEGQAYLHVGGGIVSDSIPASEYLESLDKASAPLAALEDALDPEFG